MKPHQKKNNLMIDVNNMIVMLDKCMVNKDKFMSLISTSCCRPANFYWNGNIDEGYFTLQIRYKKLASYCTLSRMIGLMDS